MKKKYFKQPWAAARPNHAYMHLFAPVGIWNLFLKGRISGREGLST